MYMPNLIWEKLMNKKILNLEVLFLLSIVIIIVFVVTNICLVMRKNVSNIINEQEVLVIASSIIENIKSRKYDDIQAYLNEISAIGVDKKIDDNIQEIVVSGNVYNELFFGVTIPKDIDVEVIIDNTLFQFDVVKKIEVIVMYDIDKKVSLTTNIQRENIKECNKPIITDVYLKDINISLDEYNIIPIRYDDINNNFIVCNENDELWYNYSSKRWAKFLAFNKNDFDIQNSFINEKTGVCNEIININNQEKNIQEYMYVWIPNFTIKDNISYFRYESSKNVISNSFLYNSADNEYLYINKVLEEANDLSKECTFDGINGVWKKYRDEEDIYYKSFNMTRFAPINIY